MSDIKSEIRKNAHACNELFKIADALRKQADDLEEKAGKVCEDNPAVFIEGAANGNFAIYISTSNLVPSASPDIAYSDIEHLAPYEDFLVIKLDKWALADLKKAIKKL